ncbi:phosphoenolpyruvate mutase [Leptospira noguchii str. 1993005606]|uniref:Phosphoenolpyruvate mutase n=1 Tax=Leptospira noguchii str. 2007001578 TaxID=1049974 RepID=A0ABN0J2X9_9LEPT|nr:phosphoenolpyruvate mutase [Leptospira noguchii str. 2007001578]EPE85887.1 phosphoenolpyruvate mutase [Leptospira noguchii str. 1993005606]
MLVGSGFSAIGTTSAGIAFAAGLPDHQILDRDVMLECIRNIVTSVDVPVSADLESGYGIEPNKVAETVRRAIEVGVVGCNIKDLSSDHLLLNAELATERIHAARQEANAAGFAFTLTARTNTFLANHPHALDETIRRADIYRKAGADCIFIPGVNDLETIGNLT